MPHSLPLIFSLLPTTIHAPFFLSSSHLLSPPLNCSRLISFFHLLSPPIIFSLPFAGRPSHHRLICSSGDGTTRTNCRTLLISFVRLVCTSSLNQSSSLKLGFGGQEPVVFGSSYASPRLQICGGHHVAMFFSNSKQQPLISFVGSF